MKLKLNDGFYLQRNGKVVEIKIDDENSIGSTYVCAYPFVDVNVGYKRWDRDGNWQSDVPTLHDWDLTKRVTIEEYPEYFI